MLFDVPGLFTLTPDRLAQTVSILAPGIPIWDQYVDLVVWVLTQLGGVLHSGGLAIIAFTIIIKTLLLPLTIKSIRSSKAMQELAPKIKEIQKKHGQDRQKASQETFALYSQHGVNPMAGCLPMLIQMPIFFGVYFGIREMSESGAANWADGFLWIPDLNRPDPLFLLPILAGFFQFIQSRMMRPAHQKVTDPQQKIMNTMMTFMPLMVVIFGWTFASGPVLYWVAQSVYSVIQQWLITGWGALTEWFPWLPELPEQRRLGYAAPRKIDDVVMVSGEGAAPQRGRFQTWLHNKMEEAQKNAAARQEALREQGKGGGKSPAAAGANGSVVETEGTTRQSNKRSGYQARVEAASKAKYRSKNGSNGSGTIESASDTSTDTRARTSGNTPKVNKAKRKKKRA